MLPTVHSYLLDFCLNFEKYNSYAYLFFSKPNFAKKICLKSWQHWFSHPKWYFKSGSRTRRFIDIFVEKFYWKVSLCWGLNKRALVFSHVQFSLLYVLPTQQSWKFLLLSRGEFPCKKKIWKNIKEFQNKANLSALRYSTLIFDLSM